MRWLIACGLVAAMGSARADDGLLPDRSAGLALDGQSFDFHGGPATGFGLDATSAFGCGRFGVLAEGGLGGLYASKPMGRVGLYGDARVGARFLAATFGGSDLPLRADLALDAGFGVGRYWLDGGTAFTRPYAFFGWGIYLGGGRYAGHLDLRISAAPALDDPGALRTICRGTCPTSSDAPVDFTILILVGVATW